MTVLTPALENAFRNLGVSPDSDRATIRSAWKAMVRAYHPDQAAEDKVEANRRLAELNAAFDLVSTWTPENARAYAQARDARADTQNNASKQNAREAAARRKAAQEQENERQNQEAEARKAAEIAARRRAQQLDQQDAVKRAAKASRAQKFTPKAATARAKLLSALRDLNPRLAARDFGLV